MIRWEYATLFVGMRGNDHVVAGLNGQVLDFQTNPQTPWDVLNQMGNEGWELVATVPCDSPFLPEDLVSRLRTGMKNNDLAVAKTGDQAHPVFALMKRGVRESLEAFLASGGRKIDAWYAALKVVEVPFDDEAEAFRNINTLDELKRA